MGELRDNPYALGVSLRGILRSIGYGTRNFPADYGTARILVGMGLAEYDVPGDSDPYWLKLTEAGRATLRALSDQDTGQGEESGR